MLYSETFQPGYWARFAPLVLREAEQGDPVSKEIVEAQVEGVLHSIEALIRSSRVPEHTTIHFSGGIVEGSQSFFTLIQNQLHTRLPRFPSRICERESYWGAWEWGKQILAEG
jgi:N-acetylglucosamine kinase-like BadF-type ATPase